MWHWLWARSSRGTRDTGDAPESGGDIAYLEESVAYSSFLASGVAGVEQVSFSEFIRHRRRPTASEC